MPRQSDEKNEGGDRRFWIALNQVGGLEPVLFYRLVEKFGDPESVWRAGEKGLRGSGLFRNTAEGGELDFDVEISEEKKKPLERLLDLREHEDGTAEINRAADQGIRIVTLIDADYPDLLRKIPVPPPVIYIKGEIYSADERRVAMVGTRTCNGYGRRMAEDIAADLARAGWTVVSGLAQGIDTAAHSGSLDAGGRTIAVKAVGLDINYPAANSRLAERIIENGALVSEFALGVKARDKWQFHRRNRIISGLSRGTIVVQSRQKGGSLITAAHANEQGREMFAVPGDAKNPLSSGCHWLIRHGAHLVESAADALEIFGVTIQRELEFDARSLDGIQKDIRDMLAQGPVHFDEICSRTGKSAGDIASALMMLEMKGAARQLPGKLYSI